MNINWKKIKLLAYDFDGVMTDNRVLIDQDGKESVFVNRSDGLAIREIFKLGYSQIILSTEKNSVVSKRAQKLNLECIQGTSDKKASIISYCTSNSISIDNVAYIGNDINDFDIMLFLQYTFAPSDAHPSIKKIANITLKTKGGFGVIRELLDLIKFPKFSH